VAAQYHDLEAAVLELPAAERLALAARLLESLPAETPEAIEQRWIIEAERRWQRYLRGETTTTNADDVFARLKC
jgi:putative addiction module component (TIGR02574 family)